MINFQTLSYNVCMAVLLKRFDPDEHMSRWYSVHVQPTLLDPVAVICAWGNWETIWQQIRVLPAASSEEAQALAEKIVSTKIKRGYKTVSDSRTKIIIFWILGVSSYPPQLDTLRANYYP